MRKKIVLLIPRTYNDGAEIPQDVLNSIYFELFVFCGGLTCAGKVQGAFRMADGTRQEDILEQVWVAVDEADIPALRAMVARFGRILRQEAMYFELTDAAVELLPPAVEEGNGNEQDD